MKSSARFWLAGTLVAAVGIAGLMVATISAGDSKALASEIDKIAAALKKGDKEGAAKEAEALAKKIEEVAEAMDLLKPRKKGGLGVGDKPGAVAQDGIEQMLIAIGRDAPAAGTLKKNAEALEQMAYRIGAIGLVTHAKPIQKAATGANRKEWNGWSNDMVEGSAKLAAAAKALGPQEVKTAAAKINAACNACHSKYR
ncbi:MAG: cytochrome c [Gemmataceae bacterium]|nr:cytochrome c [Gemmataceae bacterium]